MLRAMPRNSVAGARRTREAILAEAVDLASVEGLEGLTIGRLASALEMSKAGVIGHFGTKEQLQLATLEAAVATFTREVWEPAAQAEPGLPRLRAICAAWVAYLEGGVFPGGCFITTAATEFDAREPGPVRDAIAAAQGRWLGVLAAEAKVAVKAGELDAARDPRDVAFELNAVAVGLNQAIQLFRDRQAPARARRAMARVLGVERL